jgi:hypothetical protein
MKKDEHERMRQLLKRAVRPVEMDAKPERDLWPHVLRRLGERGAEPELLRMPVWFDAALLTGLAAFVVVFPASIPLLLYYL